MICVKCKREVPDGPFVPSAAQMNATGKAHIEFINEQQFIHLVEANSHATVSGAV